MVTYDHLQFQVLSLKDTPGRKLKAIKRRGKIQQLTEADQHKFLEQRRQQNQNEHNVLDN